MLHPSEMSMRSIIADKTAVEAGYVNHNDDLGGETNHGITRATADEHRSLWAKHNWDGDMRTLPIALAYEIYQVAWWNRMQLDAILGIYPMLADRIFDFGINAGRGNAGRSLQRLLNVSNRQGRDYPDLVVDGAIGPRTVEALRQYATRNGDEAMGRLTMLMYSMQNYHYVDICEKRERNESFMNGWAARTWRDLKFYAAWMVERYRK